MLRAPRPLGVGTAEVESLTSYIRRLARTHVVSPSLLLRRLVLDPERRRREQQDLAIEPTRATESLNGASATTELIVCALVSMTGIASIRETTLLDRSGGIEFASAFRNLRAWCALCLSTEPYDHLVWSLRLSTTCVIHRCILVDRCARCGRSHRPLHAAATPDYCPYCAGQLARRDHAGDGVDEDSRLVGDLMAVLSQQTDPAQIATFTATAITKIGGVRPSHRASGISIGELSALRAGHVRPSVLTLVRLARASGIEFSRILDMPIATTVERPRRVRGYRPRRAIAIGRAFERLLKASDEDLPSLRALARRFHADVAAVRATYPLQSQELVLRRRSARVSRALLTRRRSLADAVSAFQSVGSLSPSRRMIEHFLSRPGLLRAPYVRAELLALCARQRKGLHSVS